MTVACDPGLRTPEKAVTPTVAVRASTPGTAASVVASPATAVAQVASTPPPTPNTIPTASATPVPTPRIAIPATWQTEVEEASVAIDGFRWEIVLSGEPRRLLSEARADMALVSGPEGIPAGQHPLVLTVPFSTQWEDITLERAKTILQQGDDLVEIIPWDALRPWQRALRVGGLHPQDSSYPLQQSWSLLTTEEYQLAAEALARQLRQQESPADFDLVAVGDVMLDRALGRAIENGDLGFPFAHVQDVLRSGDITVANLESALGDAGEPEAKSYTFRAPPQAAQSLAGAGIDLVALANNHALDFGPAALMQGIHLLGKAGVATIGAGESEASARKPYFVKVKGTTLAFLGYVNVPVEGTPPYFDTKMWSAGESTPGVAWGHPEQIREDVIKALESADHVIVVLHSGYEYVPAPSPPQQASARAAIDAGAALVIGHHAHILQGVEFYEQGAIAYGLGNFAFNISGPPETAIVVASFEETGLHQLTFIPAVVQASGQPRLATETEASVIRSHLFALSRSLN